MDWTIAILLSLLILAALVLLVYMIFDKYLSRSQEEHYDKLMQQEQIDRIEDRVKILEIELCTDERHENYGHKSIEIDTNKDDVKTNVFNNQFIAHNNLENETELQCVACGSFDVEAIRSYGDSQACKMKYECETCGNRYTIKGE